MTCLLCGDPGVARQLCNRHYLRLKHRRKHNPDTWTGWPTPRQYMKNKGRRCSLCLKRSAYAKGLCRRHYYSGRGKAGIFATSSMSS